MPVDGTFLSAASGKGIYRVAGGAPIYISSWSQFGSTHGTIKVDAAAFSHAGRAGVWSHLRARPADGTFISSSKTGVAYRIAGGAPIFVDHWSDFGGKKPTVAVAPDALSHAGKPGVWSHLAGVPANGTYIRATVDGSVYRIAGGAPLFVPGWQPLGGAKPTVVVDRSAISHSGKPGVWGHLRFYPASGTYLTGLPGGKNYRVVSGRAVRVSSAGSGTVHITQVDDRSCGFEFSLRPPAQVAGRAANSRRSG